MKLVLTLLGNDDKPIGQFALDNLAQTREFIFAKPQDDESAAFSLRGIVVVPLAQFPQTKKISRANLILPPGLIGKG